HCAINSAEEALLVERHLVLPRSVAMEDRASGAGAAAVGRQVQIAFTELVAQGVFDGARYARRRLDFIERVATAFVQANRAAIERQHLVAVDGLQNAQQRLDVEAVADDSELGRRALQSIHPEQIAAGKHRQAVARMAPELLVVENSAQRLEQHVDMFPRAARQRLLKLPHQVPVADRILLALWKTAMGRLV